MEDITIAAILFEQKERSLPRRRERETYKPKKKIVPQILEETRTAIIL